MSNPNKKVYSGESRKIAMNSFEKKLDEDLLTHENEKKQVKGS